MKKEPPALRSLFPELSTKNDPTLAEAVISIWNEVLERSAWQRVENARLSIVLKAIVKLSPSRPAPVAASTAK